MRLCVDLQLCALLWWAGKAGVDVSPRTKQIGELKQRALELEQQLAEAGLGNLL